MRTSVSSARRSADVHARVLASAHGPELARADAYRDRNQPPTGDAAVDAAAAEMREEHALYEQGHQPEWLVEVCALVLIDNQA